MYANKVTRLKSEIQDIISYFKEIEKEFSNKQLFFDSSMENVINLLDKLEYMEKSLTQYRIEARSYVSSRKKV